MKYLPKYLQKIFIVFIRYITNCSLIFLICKQVKVHKKMNERWNYIPHEYYNVYGVLYSRLESE